MYYSSKDISNGIEGMMKIPETTQRIYRKKGLLRFVKIGRQIYYKREYLSELLLQLEQSPTQKAK